MDVHDRRPERRPSSAFGNFARSGWFTPTLVFCLCAALLFATHEHGRGHYIQLRQAVIPPAPEDNWGPGGQPAIRLSRHPSARAPAPEFASATLLPGRGMNLWQLVAFVPGRGNVALLASPPLGDAESLLTGAGDDANGSAAATAGAAFLAPWAGRLSGSAAPVAGRIEAVWRGAPLEVPAETTGASVSTDGLLLKRGADSVSTSAIAGSESAKATFRALSADGNSPGPTELVVMVDLSATSLDLTMSATNRGSAPEPLGLGWLPHFALPAGGRKDVLITVPATEHVPTADRAAGMPSGRVQPVEGTPYDLQSAGGVPLGDRNLDETYLDLHSALFGDGPIAELRFPKLGYGLRVIPLSSNVKNFRVIAPAGAPWVSIGPNTNVPDPFGREWKDLPSNGMVTLQPGATMEWRVRIEIFPVGGESLSEQPQ